MGAALRVAADGLAFSALVFLGFAFVVVLFGGVILSMRLAVAPRIELLGASACPELLVRGTFWREMRLDLDEVRVGEAKSPFLGDLVWLQLGRLEPAILLVARVE